MSIATSVYIISDEDLKENGGRFRLVSGGASRVLGFSTPDKVAGGKLQAVYVVPDGFPVQGGESVKVTNAIEVADRGLQGGLIATPIYVVNGDEWPTALPPTISFQTNKSGTFNPSVTKSGAAATWTIDDTEYVTNTPSVSLSGDTVDVSIEFDDRATVTQFRAFGQNLLTLLDLTALENLEKIYLYSNAALTGDVSPWGALTNLTYIEVWGTDVSGDISGWSALTGLTELYIFGTDVSGDISGWSALTALTQLRINSTSVSGNISGFSALTSLLRAQFFGTSVSGDISGWSALTSLTYLDMGAVSGVSGDVAGLNAITGMATLQLYNTSVTGDISTWAAMTSLALMYISGTSVSYGSSGGAGNWTSATSIWVHDCGWDETEVSTFVGDIYAARDSWVGGAKTLNIGGSNAAPDVTALAQITVLEASYSWTITHS